MHEIAEQYYRTMKGLPVHFAQDKLHQEITRIRKACIKSQLIPKILHKQVGE